MVHIIIRPLAASILIISSLMLQGQYMEGGLIVGGSLYDGDLSPNKFVDRLGFVNSAGGLFIRQNFNSTWSGRLSYIYGKWEADEAEVRPSRNLNFFSNYGELAALVEYNYPGFDPFGFRKFSLYAYAGVAYVHFDPKTIYNGSTVFLHELGTEGQGIEIDGEYKEFYSLNIVSIPFGGGIKYALNESLTLGLEFGPRMTFSDYLDDVSGYYVDYDILAQERGTTAANLANRGHELTGDLPRRDLGGSVRANPENNDWYFTGNLTISYNFHNLIGNGAGCPMAF